MIILAGLTFQASCFALFFVLFLCFLCVFFLKSVFDENTSRRQIVSITCTTLKNSEAVLTSSNERKMPGAFSYADIIIDVMC